VKKKIAFLFPAVFFFVAVVAGSAAPVFGVPSAFKAASTAEPLEAFPPDSINADFDGWTYETRDSQVREPKAAESKTAESKTAEPETAEPGAAALEVVGAEGAEPKAEESEITESEFPEFAGVESEDWAPDPDNAIDELMKTLLQSSPKFFDEKTYGLEGNYAVLGVENGNLEADDRLDRVRLLALRKEDGIYDRALLLEIAPPEEEPFLIHFSDDVKGFDSKIELKNFVSPRKSEILLSVKGVNDEIGRLLVVEVREKQGRVIYDSRTVAIPTIKGKFYDNYRAEVFVQETGARALIDLSSRKANYDRRRVYHESTGSLRNPITIWEDRHSELQPVDVDGDGLHELKGVIDLVGVTRADRIAYVEFTLQYDGNAWHVLESWVVPVEDLANLPIPRRINLR
jgi:hypothetical protein